MILWSCDMGVLQKKTVGQSYIFVFFIQAFLEVSKHQIHVNHMCCVHKEQSYMSVFLIHWPYILSLFFYGTRPM